MLVFDVESDGLLDTISVLHCVNIIDRSTGQRLAFNGGVYRDGTPAQRDGNIEDGLRLLQSADSICGQNIIPYDCPAIRKLYPWFKPTGKIIDTKVCSAVIWTNIADLDFGLLSSGKLPEEFKQRGLIGSHKLEAWGYRLGEFKGDFSPKDYENPETGKPHTWATIGFTPEMDTYGRQDVEVTLKLYEKIESKNYSQECLDLEHRVAEIIFRQHERGFAFSVPKAEELTHKLQRRTAEIEAELQKVFQPWMAPVIAKGTAVFTPKKDNKKQGYTGGVPFSRVDLVVFNPGSRDHIADRLKALRGWKPVQFTDGGKPQVDESVLEPLPWPEAKLLNEYLMVGKRLGQVATGDKAWLKYAKNTGIYNRKTDGVVRIHGTVQTNGAVTGRMTHANPNVGQTPAVYAAYGEECRDCWIASPGLVLVGCDAEGIELRALAHFMARYDNGEYAEAVANGKKENETDVHNVNKRALTYNKRDNSKTFVYALIYGAQGYKLGCITFDDFTDEQKAKFNATYPSSKKKARHSALKRLGDNRREKLMANLPALGKLIEAVSHAVNTRGRLVGLDGRILHVRAAHAALNTLLQSAGAVIMKKALVLFEDTVATPSRSASALVEYVANVHDEFQIETEETHAESIGRGAAECIRLAGEFYKFRCPLAGSFGVGRSWRETH
jgi:hypothetical protein